MATWIKYTIATIALPILGYFIGGIAYGFIWVYCTGGWGVLGIVDIYIAIILLFCVFAAPYYTVKLLNILWWYPAAVLAAPNIMNIISFSDSVPSCSRNVFLLLLPIFLIILIGLPAGFLGLKQRRIKNV